jgi:hypothetical protein
MMERQEKESLLAQHPPLPQPISILVKLYEVQLAYRTNNATHECTYTKILFQFAI